MGEIKCAFMNRKGYNDYYCNKVEHNVPYEIYIKYCTEYSYDECPNYKACYIATLVCNEIGDEKTKKTLETLEYLRYNILEKNNEYSNLLKTYDVVGPIIINNIIEDSNKSQIIKNLYNLGIEKVASLIKIKKEKEAIELYKDMTNLLIKGYQIKDELNNNKLLIIK